MYLLETLIQFITFNLSIIIIVVVCIIQRKSVNARSFPSILKAIIAGALASAIASLLLECTLLPMTLGDPREWHNVFLSVLGQAFLFTSVPDEIVKFELLALFFWNDKIFLKSSNGTIFTIFITIGFVIFENLLYLFFNDLFPLHLRADPLSSLSAFPGYLFAAIIMGFFFSKARINPYSRKNNLIKAVLYPILVHSMFETLLIMRGTSITVSDDDRFAFIIFFILSMVILIKLLIFSDEYIKRYKLAFEKTKKYKTISIKSGKLVQTLPTQDQSMLSLSESAPKTAYRPQTVPPPIPPHASASPQVISIQPVQHLDETMMLQDPSLDIPKKINSDLPSTPADADLPKTMLIDSDNIYNRRAVSTDALNQLQNETKKSRPKSTKKNNIIPKKEGNDKENQTIAISAESSSQNDQKNSPEELFECKSFVSLPSIKIPTQKLNEISSDKGNAPTNAQHTQEEDLVPMESVVIDLDGPLFFDSDLDNEIPLDDDLSENQPSQYKSMVSLPSIVIDLDEPIEPSSNKTNDHIEKAKQEIEKLYHNHVSHVALPPISHDLDTSPIEISTEESDKTQVILLPEKKINSLHTLKIPLPSFNKKPLAIKPQPESINDDDFKPTLKEINPVGK